jgi:NAD/NADP transhydrogenase alpha subunit
VPTDASHFFGQNLINVLALFIKKEDSSSTLQYNLEDDIVAASLVTNKGALCRQL